jgi:hypothetical protein
MYLILMSLVIRFLDSFTLRYNLSFKEKIKLFFKTLIKISMTIFFTFLSFQIFSYINDKKRKKNRYYVKKD